MPWKVGHGTQDQKSKTRQNGFGERHQENPWPRGVTVSIKLTSEMLMDCPSLENTPAIATVWVKASNSYVSKSSVVPELVMKVSPS